MPAHSPRSRKTATSLVAVHEGMKNRKSPNIDLGLDAGAKLVRKSLERLTDGQ